MTTSYQNDSVLFIVSVPSLSQPPLSPATSGFLAAYVRCRADIVAAADQLQVPLETALDLLADPAIQSRLATIEESQKRAARYAAIDYVHLAAAALKELAQSTADPLTRQKAANNLYRASIWLVRIAEGKVPPESVPGRFQPPVRRATPEEDALTPASRPGGDMTTLKPPGAPLPKSQSAVEYTQPDPEGGRCASLHPNEPSAPIGARGARPGTRHVSVGSDPAPSAIAAHPPRDTS